jgi:hypothetical protein
MRQDCLSAQMLYKKTIIGFAVIMLLSASFVTAQDDDQKKAATASSEKWLSIIDSGRYADSWENAAASLKASVPQERWVHLVQPVRDPLGKIISRKINAKTDRPTLPVTTDQESIVIRFVSDFQNMKAADVVVTLSLTKDGQWKTTGYWITQGSPDRWNIVMALLLFLIIIALWFMELKYH